MRLESLEAGRGTTLSVRAPDGARTRGGAPLAARGGGRWFLVPAAAVVHCGPRPGVRRQRAPYMLQGHYPACSATRCHLLCPCALAGGAPELTLVDLVYTEASRPKPQLLELFLPGPAVAALAAALAQGKLAGAQPAGGGSVAARAVDDEKCCVQ